MAEQISIHAPPRGATEFTAHQDGLETISIHAPPRGATWSFPPSRDYPTFQFTPLREGRLKTQEFHAMAAISIHAPPRGATLAALAGRRLALLFQFTPLREGRQIVPPPTCRTSSISIHAPPRGATVHRRSSRKPSGDFNSRPSARGDLFRLQRDYHGALISIHAPPRGATAARCPHPYCEIFQFTPLREGRLHQHSPKSAQRVYFNSRPSARGDKCINHTVSVEHISIHAPPRGATHRVEAINY